jgi:hypothetical protein
MVMSVYLIPKFSSSLKGLKREEIGDDQPLSHPSTSKTDANIEKEGEIVQHNHRLSIRAVAELVNIDKETVQQFYITI